MYYLIEAGAEVLYQGFEKAVACEIWEAVEASQVPGKLFFNGELIDSYDPLDLTIETVFDPPTDMLDFDDCEGFL